MSREYDLHEFGTAETANALGGGPVVAMEGFLLACAMLSDRAFREIVQQCEPEWFVAHAHRVLFGVFVRMHRRGVTTLDAGLVLAEAGEQVAQIGGAEYLVQLVDSVPSPQNTPYYLASVADNWRRRTIRARLESALDALDADTPDGYRSRVAAIADGLYRGEAGMLTSDELMDKSSRGRAWAGSGIPTGIEAFDNRSKSGGLDPGEFGIVQAASGKGKTLLGLQFAVHAARLGRRALFVTLELPPERLWARVMRAECGFYDEQEAGRFGCLDEWWNALERVAAYKDNLRWLDMTGLAGGNPTPDAVFGRIESDNWHDVWFLDYLQRMEVPGARGPYDSVKRSSDMAFNYTKRTGKSGWVLSQEVESGDHKGNVSGGKSPNDGCAHRIRLATVKDGTVERTDLQCLKMREGENNWATGVVLDQQRGVWHMTG